MEQHILELPLDAIQYIRELYPRLREDDAAIERYRAAVDILPPIAVARGTILVDGFHRWQAYKREARQTIPAVDLGNLSDAQILREAISRNSVHGQQLSIADKKRLAEVYWMKLADMSVPDRSRELAVLFSVSERTIREWTHDARLEEKRRLQARAWDMWLDCHTEEEIGKALGVTRQTINIWLAKIGRSSNFCEVPDSRQHFDVWQFPKAAADAGAPSFPGRMPPQVVENLLWLFTEPNHIVFDPFAGSGVTIDVAKRMGRRVWASDLTPSTPNLPIHQHDISAGWPEDAPSKVDLVLLDPPYWKQAKGWYSQDARDLGNTTLADFRERWGAIVRTCASHLRPGGYLAYIIGPSVDDDGVVDHALDMYPPCLAAGLVQHRRIIVPYQTQQATGQQVTWARDGRQLLKLYRDLVLVRMPRAKQEA